MQKLAVVHLKPGMIVGRNIYGLEGSLLLAAGVELNANYISKLTRMNIASVYVINRLLENVDIPDVIREETRVQAVCTVQKYYQGVVNKAKVDVSGLQSAADQILSDITCSRDVMVQLTDIRTYDNYTFSHSVQVCVLSVLIALAMGYSQKRLREVAVGALIHDIGKICLPLDILNKPGKLSDEEMEHVREHTSLGFDILRHLTYFSTNSTHIALSHHERYDGSGYPRGIVGSDIHEYARIVAVADVFDAVTADRPYQKAKLPNEAYQILMAGSGTQFDTNILRFFFKRICIYPVGSIVEINTGEWGLVIHVYSGLPDRPCLRILTDKCGRRYGSNKLLDLTKRLTLTVQRVVKEEEYIELFGDMYR